MIQYDAFVVGSKWPPWLGEWLAAKFTLYGCMVPEMGCVKYDAKLTVRICRVAFVLGRG